MIKAFRDQWLSGPPYLPIRGEPVTEALKTPAHQPTCVGAMLKEEFLAPLGITQGELAKSMGVSRKTINELCGNRRGAVTGRLPAPRPPPGLTICPRVAARPANRFMDHPVTLGASVNAATRGDSGAPGQAESRYCCCDSTACSCCGSRHADSADYCSRRRRAHLKNLCRGIHHERQTARQHPAGA